MNSGKALVIILTSITTCGFAQVKKTASKPATVKNNTIPKAADDNSLLWEISGKGLLQPSYLFGTMHILCAADASLSDGLKKVIKDSKQVFFEIDMDDMKEMMGGLKFARMNNGLKISDLVSPVEYLRLEKYFNDHKSILPFSMMGRFKPYFITAVVSEGIMGCEQKSSMEQMIMTEARNQNKEVLGLETIEFQSSIFDSIPYEKQAADLVSYIDSIDSFKQVTLDMVAMYRKQDINNMGALIQKSDPGIIQYMDLLLYSRNARWAEQIPEQAFEQTTLFAVGAGHLGGEKGVIELLRKKGFTVKPLKN